MAGLVIGIALLTLPASTGAQIYWANESGNTIARASIDGMTVRPDLISGATAPLGVAIDGSFVYWTNGGATPSIGRANLDGSSASQSYIAAAGAPQGLAVDNTFAYWSQVVSAAGQIGRARLSSPEAPNQSFVPAGPSPCGVASDADEANWANGGSPGSIGDSHGGDDPDQTFITATADPCGIARADGYIYWTNRAANSIGRALQDGSGAVQDFIPLSTTTGPCGVATDGQHIYWTTASNTIGRAEVDGTNPQENFITDPTAVQSPCGIAVTPMQRVTPTSDAFPDTSVGTQSRVDALLVTNHGSSVLGVTGVSLIGENRGDFEITGEGCTRSATPAGNGCVVNVRFAPSAAGSRSAALRVTSSASNSPTDVPLSGTGTSTAPAAEDARCAKLRGKLKARKRRDAKKGEKARARRAILRRLRQLNC